MQTQKVSIQIVNEFNSANYKMVQKTEKKNALGKKNTRKLLVKVNT